jgi:hypothetical protein
MITESSFTLAIIVVEELTEDRPIHVRLSVGMYNHTFVFLIGRVSSHRVYYLTTVSISASRQWTPSGLDPGYISAKLVSHFITRVCVSANAFKCFHIDIPGAFHCVIWSTTILKYGVRVAGSTISSFGRGGCRHTKKALRQRTII